MFDHAIFNDCMANVDFCEQMVKETNPIAAGQGRERRRRRTPTSTATRRSPTSCGRSTRSPASSTWRRCTSPATRGRCTACSAAGTPTRRRSCPAAAAPTSPTRRCTDYYVRLMRYFDYVKRSVPMHDDLYDFFLTELPGYDMVGYRETNLVNWGSLRRSRLRRLRLPEHDRLGPQALHHARRGDRRRADLDRPGRDQPDDPDPARLLVLRRLGERADATSPTIRSATRSTRTTRGTRSTLPRPQKRDFADKYTWVVSPRIYDKRTDTHVCCDTGGGPFARQWCTAKAGLVDFGYLKATGALDPDGAAEARLDCPRWSSSGRCPRSPTRSSATARGPTTRPTAALDRRCTAWSGRSRRSGPAGPRAGRASRSRRAR